ncbi:hypothetical protein [Actinomarinicola tropica]|uniref:HTH HARE-type domain-containing protein n=1 Tax=Actinomarinicola tropica TaxID=2789776 RepID=A0A5Q2RQR9_9ACTN|nr:hypothetical protein [Actinomarinicola tropica]QGG96240.1 hypothetical protein GH723_14640 [Actinomarinicola tropica]
MSFTDTIRRLEEALDERRLELAEAAAAFRAAELELASVRAVAAGAGPGTLTRMSRTDAILAVLRRAGTTMSPSEITSALHAAGRSDGYPSVTATLSYLLKASVVQRPARGRYLAV